MFGDMREFSSEQPFLYTSESVSEGHPDKMCDIISDSVLDAHLAQDPNSKVSCGKLFLNLFLITNIVCFRNSD